MKVQTTETEEQFHDAYDEWHRQLQLGEDNVSPLEHIWYEMVFEEVRHYGPMRVLEIGCGRGSFAIWLARECPQFEITALDYSQAAIDIAKARAEAHQSKVNFVQGDAQHLPFDDSQFDLVISCECMEHVPVPRQMAVEMHRVLKPGGRFCLTTPSQLNGMLIGWAHALVTRQPYNSGAGVQPRENFYFFWNVWSYLRSAGLQVRHTESSTFQWLLLPRVAPHKLCTRKINNPVLKRLAFPFGLHFAYFGNKPA